MKESELSSWTRRKYRHRKISWIARFRYTLKSLFNDGTNVECLDSGVRGWLGLSVTSSAKDLSKVFRKLDRPPIVLGNDKLGSGHE